MKKLLFLLCLFVSINLFAQIDLVYQKPHENISELLETPLPPRMFLDKKAENSFMLYRNQFESIERLSETELRLAGLRINPKTYIGSRQMYYSKVSYYDLKNAKEKVIKGLPGIGQFAFFNWSPNQKKIAFTNTNEMGVALWVVDVTSLEAKKLTSNNLNACMNQPFEWFSDSESLLVRTLPSNIEKLKNSKEAIPSGPTISESDGVIAQNRTYQDLLKNKNDEQNFIILAQSEIKKVDLNGEISLWKDAGMYKSMLFSPDGNYVLINEIKPIFSYLVPYYRFSFSEKVYTKEGKEIKSILDAPLEEDRAKGFMSTRKGIRDIDWRSDKSATLYWVESLDDGDASKKVEFRDEVFELNAPFDGEKKSLIKTKDRFTFISWGNDTIAIANDVWRSNRNTRRYLFNPSKPEQKPIEFHIRNYKDKYNNPGYFVTKRNEFGFRQLAVNNSKLYLISDGYSDEGIHPFIDEFDIINIKSKRIWEAEKGTKLEKIIGFTDVEKGIIIEKIESPHEYPNYYLRNINKRQKPKQMTFFKNPFEELQNVHKELISYNRNDGVELSATLYLPPGYDKNKKERLPMLMWAYPLEYKDKFVAGQKNSSPNKFIYPYYGSPLVWLLRGYVVLNDVAFPIVGEGDEEPNDSFIPQLISNAKAAINAVDTLGYIDKNRLAIGGHSYGAFMTANLLTHSDLFAAGIARSGAYNRTLTPFGFQSEERNYWESPEVYNDMSPFMHADKMKHPLLLIHGESDNNSGTYPMQSIRYFNALKGMGAICRLVILPKESHGYRARESIMHMLWEQDQWLEEYVKNNNEASSEK